MALRCFLAIGVPEPMKKSIGDIIDYIGKSGADVKWVSLENIHITLKFLGDTEETLVDAVKASLGKKTATCSPFYIKISDVGCFPSERRPRVVWMGIEDHGLLRGLFKDVEDELVKLGYPPENRPFSPHLTLGRVRSQKRISEMLKRLGEFSEFSCEAFEVRGITLMKSELKPGGAQYYSLAEIPFGGMN